MFVGVVDGFGDVDGVVCQFFVLGVEGTVGVADGVAVDVVLEGFEMLGAEPVAACVASCRRIPFRFWPDGVRAARRTYATPVWRKAESRILRSAG